jgi:small subunit ribosomal protein S2
VADVGIAELLEAGVHFGHQTRRWNPKMRRFIYGERGGIYIIDLLKTQALLAQAQEFAGEVAHRGGIVLFVGTKKQARDTIKEVAEASDMPFVNHRWLGGLLTNFQTINQRIRRLHDLERYETEGQLALLPTRERMAAQADLEKLRANLGGVKNMQRVPDAMFVIDLKTEEIAVKEARRLRIPIIGLVDTNCDPDGIDFVVPGNDDAIRSCALITQAIGQVVAEGHGVFRAEEERVRQEAEERARIEAEARAKREAEEQAKREAAEQEAAARAAAAAAQTPPAQESSAPAAPQSPQAPAAAQTAPAPTEAAPPVEAPAQAEALAPTETAAHAPPPAPVEAEAKPGQGEDAVHAEAEAQADAELHPPAPEVDPSEQGEDAVHAEAVANAPVQDGVPDGVQEVSPAEPEADAAPAEEPETVEASGEVPAADDGQETKTQASAS